MKQLQFITLLGLAAIAGNAQAKQTDNLPGLSAQSDEYFLGLSKENNPADGKVSNRTIEYFFTGKPYDRDLKSSIFRFRNYDPEFNRWTTIDPSGYPDGLNNFIYAPIPTYQCDFLGLETLTVLVEWAETHHVVYSYGDSMVENDVTANRQVKIDIPYTITRAEGAPHETITIGKTWSYHDSPFSTFMNNVSEISIYGVNMSIADHFNFTPSFTSDADGHPIVDISWAYKTGGSISYGVSYGEVEFPTQIMLLDAETQKAHGQETIRAE